MNELRKYVEKRQEQLLRYGFDERLRLPYFLAGKLNVKIAELRIQILEESKRVLETRIFDAETLKTTTQLKLTSFPASKRKRKSWKAGAGFFSSPSKILTSPTRVGGNSVKKTSLDVLEEKPKEVELRVEKNKKEGAGVGEKSGVQDPLDPISDKTLKEKSNSQTTTHSKTLSGSMKAKSPGKQLPVDPKFFKRSIILTTSDPVITRLRKEVSDMIHRMHNVDRLCKELLSKHLKSMKTGEREKELKKLLRSRIDPSKHYVSRHSYVFSCDSDKNPEVSASVEEAAEMDVMLANERGISVVFSPTKQSFFNTIVGDQRTREGRLLERLRSKFEETDVRGKRSHDTMHKCLPCAINNFSSYLVQLVAARYHIENQQNNSDGKMFNLLRSMTRNMVFTKLYDVCGLPQFTNYLPKR